MNRIRPAIFKKYKSENGICTIVNTGDWHFNRAVYGTGTRSTEGKARNLVNETNAYNTLILESKFSLCPSGSGPNSIRFWECLAAGRVPVLLSDKLELPTIPKSLALWWADAIVIAPENSVIEEEKLLGILNSISEENYNKKVESCLKIYSFFKQNYTGGWF